MIDTYIGRREWGDTHLVHAKYILAIRLNEIAENIRTADKQLDMKYATDLLLPSGKRVAFRMRNHEYLIKFPNQFTLRSSGAVSELTKVQNKLVDYILYCFESEKGAIAEYKLLANNDYLLYYPICEKTNRDGSQFIPFKIHEKSIVGFGKNREFNGI